MSMKSSIPSQQYEMVITEVMIAIVLFAISSIALTKYVCNLMSGFFLAWQKTQQLCLMHTFFESEEAILGFDSIIADIMK
ncbi:MAG TPA: hypothetical protein ACHBX0_00300 [Arsenophonus sp.]